MIRFSHDILQSNTTASTFVYFIRTQEHLNKMAKRMAHSRMARFAVFWFNVFALIIFTLPVSASQNTTILSKFFHFLLIVVRFAFGIWGRCIPLYQQEIWKQLFGVFMQTKMTTKRFF